MSLWDNRIISWEDCVRPMVTSVASDAREHRNAIFNPGVMMSDQFIWRFVYLQLSTSINGVLLCGEPRQMAKRFSQQFISPRRSHWNNYRMINAIHIIWRQNSFIRIPWEFKMTSYSMLLLAKIRSSMFAAWFRSIIGYRS